MMRDLISGVISGKEALIALANGEEVEYFDTRDSFSSLGWGNAIGLGVNMFFSDLIKFRIKPHVDNLISGEEALENYNEAQVRFSSKEDWVDLKESIFTISDILREKHFNRGWYGLVFRIKPQIQEYNNV